MYSQLPLLEHGADFIVLENRECRDNPDSIAVTCPAGNKTGLAGSFGLDRAQSEVFTWPYNRLTTDWRLNRQNENSLVRDTDFTGTEEELLNTAALERSRLTRRTARMSPLKLLDSVIRLPRISQLEGR
jgi:hypothetical protein